jgi:tRNA pseudouridine13 synthase
MKSPYELDHLIGLEHFITSTRGIEGKLRTCIEDFCVEEISNIESFAYTKSSDVEYTHFTLEKMNWSTMAAIKAIARALGVSHKRFGYAGTKDKRAATKQRVAVWRVEPGQLEKVHINGIVLSDFKKSDQRISLGDAIGNKFRITIRDIDLDKKELQDILAKTTDQLKEKGTPNYFGYQRFGTIRPNTHLVGKELVNGNLEGAVMGYLGNPFKTERSDAYDARKFLQESKDFRKALEVFPRRLNFERSMLDALSKNPRDYAGALRRLPKKLRWILVHAYQGFLFNKILSRMIERGLELKGKTIPLFGFESSFSKGEQGEIERLVLEAEEMDLENFEIKPMPELSSKGLHRDASIETEPKFKLSDDEVNRGKLKCVVEFNLPKGSYATVVLREFMKAEPMNY